MSVTFTPLVYGVIDTESSERVPDEREKRMDVRVLVVSDVREKSIRVNVTDAPFTSNTNDSPLSDVTFFVCLSVSDAGVIITLSDWNTVLAVSLSWMEEEEEEEEERRRMEYPGRDSRCDSVSVAALTASWMERQGVYSDTHTLPLSLPPPLT